MTGPEALALGIQLLREAGVPDAAGDARRLLAHALGITPGRLTVEMPRELNRDVSETYRKLLTNRAKRVPVSHLVGMRSFWGREFLVKGSVLDPRPETEILVAAALEAPFSRVLDLGTGSGCILVSLLADRPEATGLGVDLSDGALSVARENALRHGLGDRVGFVRGDWFGGLDGRFDLIVSNPPYIAAEEMQGLEPEVRLWEPRLALTDEGDGLGAYRSILSGARKHMTVGGRLMMEHGPGQAAAIARIGTAQGFAPPDIRHDFDGRERVCVFHGS